MMTCLREFTAAQTRVTPVNARIEIERVLRTCMREKRPVYLQVPSDVTHLTIDVSGEPLRIEDPTSDPERLETAATRLLAQLSDAERPALLLDMDADRFGLGRALLLLIDRAQIPFATLSTAKCALDETHPLNLGIYAGRASPAVRERIEQSDCLIAIAPRFHDTNSFWFSHELPPSTVYVRPFDAKIGDVVYEGVVAKELLARIALGVPPPSAAPRGSARSPERQGFSGTLNPEKLTQEQFWTRMSAFFRERDVVLAETGTSRVALTGIRMPAGVSFVSQGLWGSIGYTLPALLGSLLADENRRNVLFIGDGSFQLTAQELSTILRLGLQPVIFLLNNKGYTVERMILGENSAHNDIADWDYTKLASVFMPGADCLLARVSTPEELNRALHRIEDRRGLAFIEVALDYLDAPETLKVAGKALAAFEYGARGPGQFERAGVP
jgi:indolepyruvate decarboxylase